MPLWPCCILIIIKIIANVECLLGNRWMLSIKHFSSSTWMNLSQNTWWCIGTINSELQMRTPGHRKSLWFAQGHPASKCWRDSNPTWTLSHLHHFWDKSLGILLPQSLYQLPAFGEVRPGEDSKHHFDTPLLYLRFNRKCCYFPNSVCFVWFYKMFG